MTETVFQSQLEDREAFGSLTAERGLAAAIESVGAEIPSGWVSAEGQHFESVASQLRPVDFESALESLRAGDANLNSPDAAEAIIMLTGYPSLLVRDGDFDIAGDNVWGDRLAPYRSEIRNVIRSVGRVELRNDPRATWIGTCWLVEDDVLITNRHVAEFFSRLRAGRWEFNPGIEVRVDFAEEFGGREALEYLVSSIVHIEEHRNIDLAVMRLGRSTGRSLTLTPVPLDTRLNAVEYLGVIGYPADDRRNNPLDAFNRIFQGRFGVKRFAPGRIMRADFSPETFTHNCTTLGGNSGSAIMNVATGGAIGLHFGGNAQLQNYAVKAETIAACLTRKSIGFQTVRTGAARPAGAGGASDLDEARATADSFRDRNGYSPDFLGSRELSVPLPRLSPRQAREAATTSDGAKEIKYRNFSAVLSKRRRLALLTAVNIDGAEARNPPRVRTFALDPRLDRNVQTGRDMYLDNDLDRGHLVRRLDPCWGTPEQVQQANVDSMYFPNIAPQHKDLNQKIWNELEDHILGTVDSRDLKVSVFTGCIFDEVDPVQKASGIKVPMAFWKVVVSLARVGRRGNAARGGGSRRLQAQAFVLSQDHLVGPEDLERIFGKGFETFQVTVEQLERMTGLDFHKLKDADTFGLTPEARDVQISESTLETAADPMRSEHFKALRSIDDVET